MSRLWRFRIYIIQGGYKNMDDKIMLTANDVSQLLGIKLYLSYKIIRDANEELRRAGKLTIRGRVNREYLLKKLDVSNL